MICNDSAAVVDVFFLFFCVTYCTKLLISENTKKRHSDSLSFSRVNRTLAVLILTRAREIVIERFTVTDEVPNQSAITDQADIESPTQQWKG